MFPTVGKPNQVIPPAPLHPIPAVGEPVRRNTPAHPGEQSQLVPGQQSQNVFLYGQNVPNQKCTVDLH